MSHDWAVAMENFIYRRLRGVPTRLTSHMNCQISQYIVSFSSIRSLLSPYPKSVTRGSVTLPRYMDFDTAHTTSRESTSFGGSKNPARGYARETRVTTRRRPLVDATSRDAFGDLIFWTRARRRRRRERERGRGRERFRLPIARARASRRRKEARRWGEQC